MQQHRELLDCYSNGMTPSIYMFMEKGLQRDFCYSARVSIEDKLVRGTIKPQDFFAAAQQ